MRLTVRFKHLAALVNVLINTSMVYLQPAERCPKQSSEQISDGGINRRLLEPIGDTPPAEYEAMYYQQQIQAMTA